MRVVKVRLLGGFEVTVDERPIPASAWRQRRGADVVKVLALAPGHRLGRDEVVEALWPSLPADAGLANLHKASHLARRALGERDGVVLAGGQVALAPRANVVTDVARFISCEDPDAYGGELLPEDRYEDWTADPRERLRATYLDLLQSHGRLGELVREDPGNEEAQLELMRRHAHAGDRTAALRRFRALSSALSEVGLRPSAEASALERQLSGGPAVRAPTSAGAPIVGRVAELRRARSALDQAAGGRGGALLVTGEPGIGKTRLCEELLAIAADAGCSTLRGAAREAEGTVPYAAAAEALDHLLVERPELAARLSAAARAELARLSTVVEAAGEAEPRAPDRRRMFAAVGRVLAAETAERCVVLLLEDLHAADDVTIQLFHYLARAARFQRLLVVASFRPGEQPHALEEARASLLEQRLAGDIQLEALDRESAAALVARAAGSTPEEDTIYAIWNLARGNPFFTEELAAAICPDGKLRAPGRLYEILHARLARLEPPVRRLLARLAVAGRAFSGEELAGLSGLEGDDALAAADAALAAGVIHSVEGGYSFRHAIVREALVNTMPPHRRAAEHRDAAQRIAAGGGSPSRVAHHLVAGERPQEAVPWLARAASEAAAVAAWSDALRLVETALPIAAPEGRRELLAERANLLLATGSPEAAPAYAEAIAARDGDAAVGLRVSQAHAYLVAGDPVAASAAIGGLRPESDPDRAGVVIARGMAAWYLGRLDEARTAADEARALGEVCGLAPVTLKAAQLQAMIAHTGGEFSGRLRLDLEHTLRDPGLAATVFDGHLCIADYALTSGGPYDTVAAAARDLGSEAERSGARRVGAFAVLVLGAAELLSGQLEPARAHLRDAVRLNQEVGATGAEGLARARLAEAAVAGGGADAANRLLEEALELGQWSSIPEHVGCLVSAAAVRALDETERALEVVDRIETSSDPWPACAYCGAVFHVAAATACARAGQLARARHHLELGEPVVTAWQSKSWGAALTETHGAIADAEGRREQAKRLFERAAAGFTCAGQPLNAARARAAAA